MEKLGWTIEQTDKTIIALWEGVVDANTIDLQNQGFSQLINKLANLKRAMGLLKVSPKRDLLKVLALFADIDTYGAQSLYKELFLNTTITKIDAVFLGNEHNEYLTNDNEKVLDHEEAVLKAFSLPSDKLKLILEHILIIFYRSHRNRISDYCISYLRIKNIQST